MTAAMDVTTSAPRRDRQVIRQRSCPLRFLPASLAIHGLGMVAVMALRPPAGAPPRILLSSGRSAAMQVTLVSPPARVTTSLKPPPVLERAASRDNAAPPVCPFFVPPLADPRPVRVVRAEPPGTCRVLEEPRAPERMPRRAFRVPTSRSITPVARAAPRRRVAPPARTTASSGQAGVRRGLRRLQVPAPRYPEASRVRGEQGEVVVAVEVDARGHVSGAHLLSPCPYPRLNRAALLAARRARFLPALRAGHPVAAVTRLIFKFVLTGGE